LTPERVERRLTAILSADVAGYSRLMGADETGTARALRGHRDAMDPVVASYAGRIVKTTGDGVLSELGVMALIDEDTLGVEGYFEETKLPRIRVNDKATVILVGEKTPITGHVQSVAGGIEDRERSAGSNLLANVNPTFSWVRLAQRIPVRIALDPVPPGVALVSGRTATVEIAPGPTRRSRPSIGSGS
jgi:multidrug resistance efflux pump